MAGQEIIFKQGDDTTGDSGERGDATTSGGGTYSIKPYSDGELANATVLNRSIENVRKRTEVLRTSEEDGLYRLDAGVRYFISSGSADGSGGTIPFIQNWALDTVGPPDRWIFEITEPIVVQPINTPSTDVQEVAVYTFTTPVTGTLDLTCTIRAYTGANLIKVIWQEVDPSELTGALEANYCDAVISGDPEHILTISVRSDNITTIGNVANALTALGTALTDIGLTHSTTGSTSAYVIISSWDSSNPDVDYQFNATFERELHYITPTAISTFFTTNHGLADGDTLAIQFVDVETRREQYIGNTDPDPTTVTSSMLFITTDNPDRIPNGLPLCKRIGDYLYWIDGTVIIDSQALMFGEHGNTVSRLVTGGITYNSYSTASPASTDILSITGTPSLQDQMEATVDSMNRRASLITSEVIFSTRWLFDLTSPLPGSSYPNDYRLGVYTVIENGGAYVDNWYKNFGSIITAYSATNTSKMAAGYFEASSVYGASVEEINSIKSQTDVVDNINSGYVYANEFILNAYNINNTNLYTIYAALTSGDSLTTFLGYSSAIKAVVNVDGSTMHSTLSAFEVDLDLLSDNSGVVAGAYRNINIDANCSRIYGDYTDTISDNNIGSYIYGDYRRFEFRSGTTLTGEFSCYYNVAAIQSSINQVRLMHSVLYLYGDVTGELNGSYVYLQMSSSSEASDEVIGYSLNINNNITTRANTSNNMGGFYASIETTPLRSSSTNFFAFKSDVVLTAGSDHFAQQIELLSLGFTADVQNSIIMDEDIYASRATLCTEGDSAINMQSSQSLYGYHIELGAGYLNCDSMYFFTGECNSISGADTTNFGPKSMFTLYDDYSNHNPQLIFRKTDKDQLPVMSGRVGTISWGGKYDSGVSDWDDYGASIYAIITNFHTSASEVYMDLELEAPNGDIYLNVDGGSMSLTAFSSTEGPVLNASRCSFVRIPIDVNVGSMTGFLPGFMYCERPTGNSGNVVLYIYTGSVWRSVTLT